MVFFGVVGQIRCVVLVGKIQVLGAVKVCPEQREGLVFHADSVWKVSHRPHARRPQQLHHRTPSGPALVS